MPPAKDLHGRREASRLRAQRREAREAVGLPPPTNAEGRARTAEDEKEYLATVPDDERLLERSETERLISVVAAEAKFSRRKKPS